MIRLVIALTLPLLWFQAALAQTSARSDLYTTRALVTGKDERNRPLGFRLCFEDALVKVSGDSGILADERVPDLATHAERYIARYSYRDLLEGKPNHDEQGTYDRPFFLTCLFDPAKLDAALGELGSKPWLGQRPSLALVLAVHGRTSDGLLSADGPFDPDMRQSLETAAQRYGLTIIVPSAATLRDQHIRLEAVPDASSDRLQRIAAASGADLALVGDLAWSDAALGWVASWRLADHDQWQRWRISGVNYDEAFRNGVRGAMSVLSGHGTPAETHEP